MLKRLIEKGKLFIVNVLNESYVDPKWYRHEALDRTNGITETLHNQIVSHPYYLSGINPKFNNEIDEAFKHISSAYQLCGNEANEIYKKIKLDVPC